MNERIFSEFRRLCALDNPSQDDDIALGEAGQEIMIPMSDEIVKLRAELAQVRNAERKVGTMNDPDEKPIDLDAPIMITGREYETLKGELAQALEDQMLAQVAMIKAYYGCLMIEAHGGQIPLIELKAAMQAIETELRITPYWPE